MKNFSYSAPQNLEVALNLLTENRGKAKILAGGTDILVKMKDAVLQPEVLIDLKRISGYCAIEYNATNGLRIGTLALIRDIEKSEIIKQYFPILSQSAATVGSVQIRNKATIGGNICHGAPSADMAPALIALSAQVKLVKQDAERLLPVEDFFKGPGETAIEDDEILTEFLFPSMAGNSDGVYLKIGRRKAVDLAVAGVATVLTMDAALSTCEDIKIVLGAVAPVPMRAKKAEDMLRGKKLSEDVINGAAKMAAGEAKPITDVRGSEWYRRQIVEALVRRTINTAYDRIKAN